MDNTEFERAMTKLREARLRSSFIVFSIDFACIAFQLFISWVAWGNGLASFIATCALVWCLRELVGHVQRVRMMIDEENKLRRSQEASRQSADGGN